MSMDVKPTVNQSISPQSNANWDKQGDPVQNAKEALQAYLKSLERAETKQMPAAPPKPSEQKSGLKSPTNSSKNLSAAEDDDRWNVFSPHPVRRNTIHSIDPKEIAAAVAAAGPRRGSALPRLQQGQRPNGIPKAYATLPRNLPSAGPINPSSANARLVNPPNPAPAPSSNNSASTPATAPAASAASVPNPVPAPAPAPAPAPTSASPLSPSNSANELFSPRRNSIH